MKKLVLLLLIAFLATPAMADNIKVRHWMNEDDASIKLFYTQGAHEGITAGWLASAKTSGVSEEKIDSCMSYIDSVSGQFGGNFVDATNYMVARHLDNGGKTEDLLILVLAKAYLTSDACVTKAKGTSL